MANKTPHTIQNGCINGDLLPNQTLVSHDSMPASTINVTGDKIMVLSDETKEVNGSADNVAKCQPEAEGQPSLISNCTDISRQTEEDIDNSDKLLNCNTKNTDNCCITKKHNNQDYFTIENVTRETKSDCLKCGVSDVPCQIVPVPSSVWTRYNKGESHF